MHIFYHSLCLFEYIRKKRGKKFFLELGFHILLYKDKTGGAILCSIRVPYNIERKTRGNFLFLP